MANTQQMRTVHTAATQSKNWGGTLMGVLLGLGLGLLIAAVVAYFVFQGGTPFKTPNNPNPPSASLPPVKAPEPVAQPANTAPKPPLEAKAPPAPEMPPPKEAMPLPPDLKEVPARKSEPAPRTAAVDSPPPAPSNDNKPLFLQAGAFNNKSEAENRRALLALVGLEGKITEITKDDKPMYRVRVGPFDSPESATKARGDMARNGIDSVLVR